MFRTMKMMRIMYKSLQMNKLAWSATKTTIMTNEHTPALSFSLSLTSYPIVPFVFAANLLCT